MLGTSRSCHLRYFQFPKYWKEVTEPIVSADDTLARMKEIENKHISEEGEQITVFIEDSEGETLHVGLAGELWMVTHIHRINNDECEYQYAVGDKWARGSLPFLFPEWTDVSRKRVIPKATGEMVVREWIESGVLSNDVEWSYDYL